MPLDLRQFRQERQALGAGMAPIYRVGAVLSTVRSVRSRELPAGVNHLMRRCDLITAV